MKLKSAFSFAIGPLLTAAIGLVTVPLMAWSFSPEDVARFAIFQTTANFALLLLGLGLDQVFVREFNHFKNPEALSKTCLLPSLLFLTIISIALIPSAEKIALALYDIENASLTYLTLFAALLLIINKIAALVARMQHHGLIYTAADIITKLILLFVIFKAANSPKTLDASALMNTYVLSFFIANFILIFFERTHWKAIMPAPFLGRQIIDHLSYGLPLAIAGIAYWALTASGVFYLRQFSTLAELAKYSLALSFSNAAVLIQTIFVLIWTPIVYRWVANGLEPKQIEKVAHTVAAIIGLIFCCAGMLSKFLYLILPDQYNKVGQLVISGLVLPLLYTISEVTYIGITVSRKTSLALWASVTALMVSSCANLFLASEFGAAGSIIASSLGGLVFLICRTELACRAWKPIRRARLHTLAVGMTTLGSFAALELENVSSLAWFFFAALVTIFFHTEIVQFVQATRIRTAKKNIQS